MKKNGYRYQFIYKPGVYLPDKKFSELVEKIRETAATCFEELPPYQVMMGTRDELRDKVISVAWKKDGAIAGFCSTVILKVERVGYVQHLGLTCVRPEDRSNGLTHILTHKAVAGFLMRYRPLVGRLWISNCAAVLSSLVNVSLYFEDVYPSPHNNVGLSDKHKRIAEAIDNYYRDKVYTHRDAVFDRENFVFRGSVKDTVFQKNENDIQYFHRNKPLNDFYKNRMEFHNGDEVLQVGFASTFAAVRHLIRNVPPVKTKQPGRNRGAAGIARENH